jgi:beta-lactamase regulating signal transducer with metallopeptidase domain
MMTSSALCLVLISTGLMQSFEGVSRLAAGSVISGLWQGIALAAGAALCLRLVPKTTAAVRFTVWTGVFAALALLPLFHAYLWRTATEGSAGRGPMVHVDERWSFAIAVLWLAMSVCRGVKLVEGAVRLRRIWKRAVPVSAEQRGGAVLAKTGTRIAMRGAQLCTSADVDRPSVIGFLSPRILIPEGLFGQLSEQELEQIVLHEAGHLRRADDWMNLLQKLSLVLVPLNPVLVWIERQLCFERELACDDEVLVLTGSPKTYAMCLTNLAEHRLERRTAALSLGAWERRSELGRRVHRILRRGETMSGRQARIVVVTLGLVLATGATELSRCPQLVSFSGRSSAKAAVMSATGRMASATYQPVIYRAVPAAQGNGSGTAHETLLKATMPLNVKVKPNHASTRRNSGSSMPLLRVKQRRPRAQQERQWVVLTSWNGMGAGQPAAIFAISENQISGNQMLGNRSGQPVFSSSYAAVPTEAGWLVIQL